MIACKHLQPNQLYDETEVRGSLFGQTADGSKFCVSSHICIILAVANSLVTMVEFLNFWYIPRKISICAPVFASTGGGEESVEHFPSIFARSRTCYNKPTSLNYGCEWKFNWKNATPEIDGTNPLGRGCLTWDQNGILPTSLSESLNSATNNFSHSHTGMTYWVRLWWKAAAPARTGLRWQNSQYRILILFIVFANTYPLKYALISLHHRFLESARDITDWTTERE